MSEPNGKQGSFGWTPQPEAAPSQPQAARSKERRRDEPRTAPVNAALGEQWLTPNEAFVYLGLPTRKALYQAVRRGYVPVHRFGKRGQRFSRAELDRVLLAR